MKKTKTKTTFPLIEREISSLREEIKISSNYITDISFFLYQLKEYSSQSSEMYLKYLILKESLLEVIAMMIDLSRELQKVKTSGGIGEQVHVLKQTYESVLDETNRILLTVRKEVKP
jgi:hydrogenase maturation factor HypF (carbamoyltransferase family)